MEYGMKSVCLFASLCLLYTSGLLLFSRGFLLNRVGVEKSSNCSRLPMDFGPLSAESNGIKGCWMPGAFSKAVVLIIDGLRYDFVRWNGNKTTKVYENKLTLVQDLLNEKPHHTYLAKFAADSPTTTMQRIKGLTTGGLPTFIDIEKNFGADEITEDNFINQLTSIGKRLEFMGDDTWGSLFPKSFFKSFPFPSFNVKDLHSVDDGILKNLVPELRNKDWDVLIAHFLGVDHCGHRFGPNHPTMAEKLTQMNLMLRSVVENIANDTILFVMGDHGMTESGDHGGDSELEVSSALFAYSPQQLHSYNKSNNNLIRQIDFVPTVSLLLGAPIPFGNLGTVIKELFPVIQRKESLDEFSTYKLYERALALNVLQVNEYLEEYNAKQSALPSDSWHKLQTLFQYVKSKFHSVLADSSDEDFQFQEHCKEYLQEALEMCRKVWTQFDFTLMLLGIGLLSGVLFMNGCYLRYLKINSVSWKLCTCLFFMSLSLLLTVVLGHHNQIQVYVLTFVILTSLLLCTRKIISLVVVKYQQRLQITSENLISSTILLFYFGSFFSNSFVINEAHLLNYFIQGLLWSCIVLSCITGDGSSKTLPEDFKAEKNASHGCKKKFTLFCNLIIISVATRLSLNFLRCREEQYWCAKSDFFATSSSTKLSELPIHQFFYFSVMMCHIAIPSALLWWLKTSGNLNGHSLSVISTKYFLILGSVCTCYYWTIQLLPNRMLNKLPQWHQLWIPWLSFFFYGVVIFCCMCSSLFIYLLPKQPSLTAVYPGSFSSISNLYFHLKNNWQKHLTSSSSSASIPVVYGLASVYSANILVTTFTFALLSMLLLEIKTALVFALLLVCVVATLNVSALRNNVSLTLYPKPHWTDVVLWGLLSSFFFYSTGHQPAISAIPWNAAFVGSDGEFASYYVPAVKILINIFCAFVVFSLALPLLFYWSYSFRIHFLKTKDEAMYEGEFLMFKESDVMFSTLFQLFLDYALYSGIKVLATICAAAYHRRHLMVWKIFAPRFMFEGIAFLFVQAALCITNLLILKIHSQLKAWIGRLERNHSKVS